MVDNVDQNVRAPRRRARRAGRARQHDRLLHVRQRRVARGRARRHDCVLRAPARRATTSMPTSSASTLLGGPQTTPHYPRGWAMAGNTPFRLYKINTHAGGHSVPFVVSWPDGLGDRGTLRRQYAHVTDILPTLLDIVGVERRRAHGHRSPLAGRASGPRSQDPAVPSSHTEQLYEMNGHRGFYRDGWEVVTLHQPLTPFTDDGVGALPPRRGPHELDDLSAERARRGSSELADAWETAAWENAGVPARRGREHQVPPASARSVTSCTREPVTISRGYADARALALGAADLVPRRHDHGEPRLPRRRPGLSSSRTATRARGTALYVLDDELRFVHNDGRGHVRELSGGTLVTGVQRDRRRARRARPPEVGRVTSASTASSVRPSEGFATAVRDRAVRGHRRRHRPPVAGVVGSLRAVRPVPVHGHAPLRPVRAR